MKLNLVAEFISVSQLLKNIQGTPTYYSQEPISNRISLWLKNVSAKKITIPAKTVIFQGQMSNNIPKLYASLEGMSMITKQEEGGS